MDHKATLRFSRDDGSRPFHPPHLRRLPRWACFAFALALLSCGRGAQDGTIRFESLKLPHRRYGPVVSSAISAGRLAIAFSDRENASLSVAYIPLTDAWTAAAPTVQTVDKIDWADGFAQDFGSLLLAVDGDRENLFYLDREREGMNVLKWASRRAGTDAWEVDALAPPGRPVAFVPEADGTCGFYWFDGDLYRAALPPLRPAGVARKPVSVSSVDTHVRISPDGNAVPLPRGSRRGFTAYDPDADRLSFWEWTEGRLVPTPIHGGGRTHYARSRPDGLLDILLYDGQTRKIGLYEQSSTTDRYRETGVTLADGTTALFLQPGKEGIRFLYTERVPDRTNGSLSVLSLLQRVQGKYVKRILSSGTTGIQGLSICEDGGVIYAALLRDTIEVLRIGID